MALGKSNKLSQTAVLKQILKRCSSLGKKQGYDQEGLPLDVPKGTLQYTLVKIEQDTLSRSPS
ncbi:Auxin-responsive protein SAUR50 [Vitis vinifera]|uniref:Auxin-responsive protein SAUR50 n=1 Tax=Vitis vinifera TaxID=29760 RepID=A0A438J361_VITVI|nr:Auxin-responsive protein SAUR50 [Vitis vinifera]